MKFSIVTPSFNQGRYIERTIQSVLSQQGVDIEYSVIDNCSTDNTVEVLKRYQTQNLKMIVQTDQGQFDAINQGWQQATGDVLAWLNADDVYLDNSLAQIAEFFKAHPDVMAVYGEAVYIDAQDNLIKPVTNIRDYSQERLRSHDFITQPTTFIRRQVFEQVGLLSGDYRYVFDWEYWIRISSQFKFVRVPIVIAGYRITGENLTTTGRSRRLREMLSLVYQSGGWSNVLRFGWRLLRKYLFAQPEIPPVNSASNSVHLT